MWKLISYARIPQPHYGRKKFGGRGLLLQRRSHLSSCPPCEPNSPSYAPLNRVNYISQTKFIKMNSPLSMITKVIYQENIIYASASEF